MPEGDTIHRLADRLQPLEGRLITHSDFRVPDLATASLTGRRITRVWAWGKNLYWDCADEAGSFILHTHLRMDGTWRLHPAGSRWTLPAHTARLVVRVAGPHDSPAEVELVGHDLGMTRLFPASDYPRRTAHLGPDPYDDDWSTTGRWDRPGRDEAVARLSGSRPTLGEALIDQSVIAGVGNEYRNELCFLLGRHPTSPVSSVDPQHAVDLAAQVMQANRRGPRRVFTGVDAAGETTWVFGRKGRACRRCRTTIQQGELGGATSVADPRAGQERIIWWCPTCQH